MQRAGVKTLAAVDRGDDDLGRTEQHRVDGVEIALEALEDLGERRAVVARRAARQRLGERFASAAGPVTNSCTRPP